MRCNNIYEKLIINLNISLPRMEFLKMCKNTGSTMSSGYRLQLVRAQRCIDFRIVRIQMNTVERIDFKPYHYGAPGHIFFVSTKLQRESTLDQIEDKGNTQHQDCNGQD